MGFNLIDMIVPVIKGGFFLVFLCILLWTLWQGIKMTGIQLYFKKKVFAPVPTAEQHRKMMEFSLKGKTLEEVTQYITRFQRKEQEQYLKAFSDVQEILAEEELEDEEE